MDSDEVDDAELPLIALLQRSMRWFSDELLERLRSAGVESITPAHTLVLAQLGADVSMSIAELARRAGVTRQTMHRAVAQLVDEGLLTSAPGPGFPRSTAIGLTAAGHRRRQVAVGILRDLERELGDELGRAALKQLRVSLARVGGR